ncbi:hypothetical protein [Singulisphaera acidiphila]|uniref:Uncharacterized protein n=1 Tax=Singulisphaera acidiphila (strain ATCC BAA-1392 / DSM 18658 / VKM B-2454 / MOB10) TaxID=886293 RepID=L0DRP2_SINAD|nr:hypothetical protein [Singulisphaera acidiphila]AGA31665.1 hypothetical protein Sinac_7634 [Singulisphaera acidiphila DSM 18658]
MSLLANGLNPDGMLFEDAVDAVGILEMTKRTVPRNEWVDLFAAQAEDSKLDGFF